MHAIIHAWKNSLSLLTPRRLARLFTASAQIMGRAIKGLGTTFSLFFLIDIGLYLAFGSYVATVQQDVKAIPMALLFITLVQSICWSLGRSALFLLMRKDDNTDLRHYFAAYLLKLAQIIMLFLSVILLGILVLASAGITKIPTLNWYGATAIVLGELIVVFYWLDGPFDFKSLFTAIEGGINLIFYNIPFVIIILGLLYGIDFGLAYGLSFWLKTPVSHVLFASLPETLALAAPTYVLRGAIIAIKYATALIEFSWIALVLNFYRRSYRNQYATSIFGAQ